MSLLSKGLSFIPTDPSALRIRQQYQRRLEMTLDRQRPKAIGIADGIALDAINAILRPWIATVPLPELSATNLSHAERLALQTLMSDASKVVLTADKNLGICVLSLEHYNSLAMTHLSDTTLYKRLDVGEELVVASIRKGLSVLLAHLSKAKRITNQLASKLLGDAPTSGKWVLPAFTVIPKVHKSPLAGRPIVRAHRWALTCLSKYLSPRFDQLRLRYEELTGFSCVLENSFQLAREVSQIRLKKADSPVLVTLDFESLYTNLHWRVVMTTLREVGKDLRLNVEAICRLTEFLLTNNCFTFDNSVYQQLQGIAMGTNCAVTLANLVITYQTHKGLLRNGLLPLIGPSNRLWYLRTYIDDVIAICRSSEDAVVISRALQSAVYPAWQPIKLTAHGLRVNYLDLTLEVRNSRQWRGLVYSLYTNPMNKHQYVHYKSDHSPGVTKGIVISGYHRAILLNWDESQMKQHVRSHTAKLWRAGYPIVFVQQIPKPKWEDKPLLTQQMVERMAEKHRTIRAIPLDREVQSHSYGVFWFFNTWHRNAELVQPLVAKVKQSYDAVSAALPNIKVVQMRNKTLGELLHKPLTPTLEPAAAPAAQAAALAAPGLPKRSPRPIRMRTSAL